MRTQRRKPSETWARVERERGNSKPWHCVKHLRNKGQEQIYAVGLGKIEGKLLAEILTLVCLVFRCLRGYEERLVWMMRVSTRLQRH